MLNLRLEIAGVWVHQCRVCIQKHDRRTPLLSLFDTRSSDNQTAALRCSGNSDCADNTHYCINQDQNTVVCIAWSSQLSIGLAWKSQTVYWFRGTDFVENWIDRSLTKNQLLVIELRWNILLCMVISLKVKCNEKLGVQRAFRPLKIKPSDTKSVGCVWSV